jgi:hypothetical protein
VFGRVVEERLNSRTKEKDAVYRVSELGWVRVPEYSLNLTASMEVENKLEDLGWRRHVPPAGLQQGRRASRLCTATARASRPAVRSRRRSVGRQ